HAIVYVPPQDGIPTGRFFDATADALDLASVPRSDVGTHALVYDPQTHEHAWKDVEFQPTDANFFSQDAELTLRPDGSATAEATLLSRGAWASALRVGSRNAQQLKQALQQMINDALPGARLTDSEVLEAKDLHHPAKIQVKFDVPAAARLEDGK